MTRHENILKSSPATCHYGSFDARLPPAITVRSGESVVVETISGSMAEWPTHGFDILPEHRAVCAALQPDPGPHILTGPIGVEDAEIGDVLEVYIEDVALRQNWAWTVIRRNRGTLPEDFPEEKLWYTKLDPVRNVATLPWGSEIELKPFFGIMGVAPRAELGRLNSIPPSDHGGNVDLKELRPGTSLLLPVWAPGALFSVGDGHAVQGDGEVCLTALETALTGTFRLVLHKGRRLPLPIAETPTHLITMGFHPDLDEAAKIALRSMIAQIQLRTRRSAEEAYMLCSLAADLRVTQLVDGNKGIHVMLERRWI